LAVVHIEQNEQQIAHLSEQLAKAQSEIDGHHQTEVSQRAAVDALRARVSGELA
jgi:hypothetical protein